MAMVEVKDDGPQGGGGEFFQFNAVGDKLDGYFADSYPSRSKHAKPGANDLAYRFYCQGNVMKIVDPPHYKLRQALEKLTKEGKLVKGVRLMMTVTGEIDVSQQSKMKTYTVMVDLDDAGKPIANPAAIKKIDAYVPPGPPPKPAAAPAAPKQSDDPFADDVPL